jgi:hypothetical protein
MSDKSARVLLSCLVIGLVMMICVGAILAGGLSLYMFLPQNRTGVNESQTTENQVTEVPSGEDAPQGSPPSASGGLSSTISAEILAQMDQIELEVIELRGLEPLGDINRILMTREELREIVLNDFLEDFTEEDARDDAIELAAFGLVNKDFDLFHLYMELFTEQIAGFYDRDEKTMYVVQEDGFRGPQRMTYAHEYVHALQDQHYDFEEGLVYTDEACEEDSERCLALQALIEGDASFIELEWFFNYSTEQDLQELQEFFNSYSSPVLDQAPAFIQESLLFPYRAGQEFVEYLYDSGGWKAIEEAYRNPPISSTQIMHPDRYPGARPVEVDLPDLLPLLGEGWREISRNVVGEYYTYLILAHGNEAKARVRDIDARDAAEGWSGDLYVVYYQDTTGETVMLTKTLWESNSDAGQFAEVFRTYASARFGRPTNQSTSQWTWTGSEGATVFTFVGNETVWVLAPDQSTADQILFELQIP